MSIPSCTAAHLHTPNFSGDGRSSRSPRTSEKEAKERKVAGKADLSRKSDEGRTDEQIAKLAGVSRDTVRKSEIIEKEAPSEVKEAARKGEMSVNKAFKATRPPKEEKKPADTRIILPPPVA